MNYLFVDGNGLGYYHHESDKLSNGDMEVQAIFGFLKNVRRYASILRARPVILWDGFSDNRREFYPEYKSNRDEDAKMKAMKEGFAKQKPFIKDIMRVAGVNQITAVDGEADDLAGMLVAKYRHDDNVENVYLLTGDSDWKQLVNEKTTWVALREDAKHKRINMEMFAELTGYPTPKAFLEGKALQGDKSDNIQQVGGIGEKGAQDLLHEYGSIVSLVRGINDGSIVIDSGRNKTAVNKLARNEFNEKTGCKMLDAFLRNIKLMNLIQTQFAPTKLDIVRGEQDFKRLEELCNRLNFRSIVEDFEVFVVPFERYCGASS